MLGSGVVVIIPLGVDWNQVWVVIFSSSHLHNEITVQMHVTGFSKPTFNYNNYILNSHF